MYIIDHESGTDSQHYVMFTFFVNASCLHAVKKIHSIAFCGDCSGFLYSNWVFLETDFYCGFDEIICFTIRSTYFWKWSNAKMNDTTRTASFFFLMNTTSRYKTNRGNPQQASEMQYPVSMAEFTRKVNSANSVCNVFTFVAHMSQHIHTFNSYPSFIYNRGLFIFIRV